MPVAFEWHPEPFILLATVSGELTADQIEEWLRDYKRIIDASPSNVLHFIVDLRPMTRTNVNIMRMPGIFAALRHPHGGWTAIIGTTPLISFWLQLLGRTTLIRFKLFPNVEEATNFLLELVRISNEKAGS